MSKINTDPRIDAYIEECADFAKPILKHLRKLVKKACPAAQETLKWQMPFFTYDGKILCGMAGFKAHCRFGIWKSKVHGFDQNGHIKTMKDLPSDKALIAEIHEEMNRILKAPAKKAAKTAGVKTVKKAPPRMPADFKKALSAKAKALTHFTEFSPSKKKDYIVWVTEAKTEATRSARIKNAVLWCSQGKSRNWKYEK